MRVYVDQPVHPLGRMLMCHMVADTLDELLDMADRIEVPHRYLQTGPVPHFDISKGRRKRALKAGAVEVCRRGMARRVRALRSRIAGDPEERARIEHVCRVAGVEPPRYVAGGLDEKSYRERTT